MNNLMQYNLPIVNPHALGLSGKPVSENHYDLLIKDSSYVRLEGNPPIVYLDFDLPIFDELVPHLQTLNFSESQRKKLGTGNKSILFGAVSAAINRNRFCNYGAVTQRDTALHNLLYYKYSSVLSTLMAEFMPGWSSVNRALRKRAAISDDYFMPDADWTSGIINKNSPHQYHLDELNTNNMLSAMITMKNAMSGGYLVFPEYRVAFEVKNRSVIFFCGRKILHGVSPIYLEEDGYRYSSVYYTTESLKSCDSFENELRKALAI